MPVEQVFDKVRQIHQAEAEITDEQAETLAAWVRDGIDEMTKGNREQVQFATKELERLEGHRSKLLSLYYEDAIDRDRFRSESDRLDKEERNARLRLAEAETGLDAVEATIAGAVELLRSWPERMDRAKPETQDRFHSTFYDTFMLSVDDDSVPSVTAVESVPKRTLKRALTRVEEVLATNENEPEAAPAFSGSNMYCLAPPTGFEPVTNGLEGRCSIRTELRRQNAP